MGHQMQSEYNSRDVPQSDVEASSWINNHKPIRSNDGFVTISGI
jgi:hypothetical protein